MKFSLDFCNKLKHSLNLSGGLNIFCPICGADHSGEDDSSPEEAGIDTKHMQGFVMKLE